MILIIGHNIVSALGFSSDENYLQVRSGTSGVRRCENVFGVPEPFAASLINDDLLHQHFFYAQLGNEHALPMEQYSPFEMAAIVSAADAIRRAKINPAESRVLFVFSTTKGNVAMLEDELQDVGQGKASPALNPPIYLASSARRITEFFGNRNTPVVVSNACISGAAALLAAKRALDAWRYDFAVVVGADRLSKFIVSGFQSFKALAPERCKPFDSARCGLNLGEAAATMVLANVQAEFACRGERNSRLYAFSDEEKMHLMFPPYSFLLSGAIRNDANHISGPSRTGEGALRALQQALQGVDRSRIAFVCTHGTASVYNDEMESIAIDRAGLSDKPINGLKAYFGHTLGAAGILESIISLLAMRDGVALKTLGYEASGVSRQLNMTTGNVPVSQPYFVKMLSGFGGGNAALLFGVQRGMKNFLKE